MDDAMLGVVMAAGLGLLALLVVLIIIARRLLVVARGTAIVITGGRDPQVVFTRALVLPFLHRAETIDLAMHSIQLSRRGRDGLVCRDSIRADVQATFLVRVNRTAEDVLRVADSVGCARASDPAALEHLFAGKFGEALATVARMLEFTELVSKRQDYKDQVIEVIGRDLAGYILDDLVIDSIDQTPISALDPHNILDAEGIRKITEVAARHNVVVHELQQKERQEIARQQLYADEAMLRIEAERAEAEADAKARMHGVPLHSKK
jgi:uncharacterized membrane protein YqiK